MSFKYEIKEKSDEHNPKTLKITLKDGMSVFANASSIKSVLSHINDTKSE